MRIFFAVFEIVVNLFEYGLIFLLYYRQLGTTKKKLPFAILTAFCGAVFTTLFNNIDSMHPYICVAVLGIYDLLFAFFLFNGSKTRKVIFGIVPSVLFSVSEYLSVLILSLFVDNVEKVLIKYTAIRFEVQILYLFINVALFLLASSIKRRKGTYLPVLHRIILAALVTACIFATSMLVHTTLSLYLINYSYGSTICAALTLVLFIICIGIIFLFYSMSSVFHRNNEMQIAMQKAEYEKRHTEDLYNTYQKMRMWKHDTTSRFGVIKSLAKEGKTDDIIRFIGEAENELSEFYSYVNTGHPVVDAVISNEISVAKSKGIDIRATILLPENLPLSDSDMCSLFSNLLDNAVEAVAKLNAADKKYILFDVGTKGKMMFINVENPSDGKYSLDRNGNLKTTKTINISMHGLGIARVKSITEKSGGSISISPEKDRFSVYVILPPAGSVQQS